MKIMKDHRSWQFTDEQIIAIKHFNADAITKFYNDNYRIFFGMARRFLSIQKNLYNRYYYELDDLLQQIYVDIPYYNYSTPSALYFCIVKGTFLQVNYGGIRYSHYKFKNLVSTFSYDKQINGAEESDTGSYLLDKFASSPSPYDMIISEEERNKNDKLLIEFLEKTIQNKRDLNVIFCEFFTDIPKNEVRGDEFEYYKQCCI